MALTRRLLTRLLDEHAPARPVPLVPELSAWWAEDELPLWQALESAAQRPLPAPFFCVPWPGAQAAALAVRGGLLDVKGRDVLDVGCGSGVAAVACALEGARVLAVDLDPLACLATTTLAARHEVQVRALAADALAVPELARGAGVVLVADLVYSRGQAERLERALDVWRRQGGEVVLADSGRPFFRAPKGAKLLLERDVPVPVGVEGDSARRVRLWRA